MSLMANYWSAKGKKITLITIDSETTDFYALSPEIKRVALGLMAASGHPREAVRNNLRRLRRLRQEIRVSRPDAVISFMDRVNVLTLLASYGLDVPVVVSERTDATQHRIGRLWAGLRRLLYPRAHAVVVQSDNMRRWAEAFVRKEKVYVLPNPIASPVFTSREAPLLEPYPRMVAMGRLGPEKGFDLLIRAFARCAAEHREWVLVILGEGDERERLSGLAGDLGITDRVLLPGRVQEPAAILRFADLFVLSSRYEGFPNVLLEAMACGLPVVGFDCPSGPREIIRDGVDGVLVPPEDVAALAMAMDRLMSDEAERKRMASRAVEVTERFGMEKVMGIWEAVLSQALKRA